MDNPFYNRLPIKNKEEFFGRDGEINGIFALLDKDQPQSISIIGERRLGKTSLLYQVIGRYREKIRKPDDYLFCYIDLQEREGLTSKEAFYEKVMGLAGIDYSKSIDYCGFESGLKRIRKVNGKKLVLLLDEFDTLIKEPIFDSQFLGNLRSLPPKYDIAYITVSQRPLKEICHKKAKGSPFFNIFHNLCLGVFKEDEARKALSVLSGRGGMKFQDDTIDAIISYIGYHPFFIQLIGYYIFDELIKGGSIEVAKDRFMSEARGHLDYLWEHLNEREKKIIKDIRRNKEDIIKKHLEINKEEMERLISSGWLIEKDGKYSLVKPFIEGLNEEPQEIPSSIEELLRQRNEIDEIIRKGYVQEITVVFTDIVGSAEYFAKKGDIAGRAMVQEHNNLLFPIINEYQGKIIKTIGDAIMAGFDKADDGVSAGIEMQEALAKYNQNIDDEIHIRIGIHTGKVIKEPNDIYGDTVNTAARVEALACGDQILISEATKDELTCLLYLKM